MPVTREQAEAVIDRVVAFYEDHHISLFGYGLTRGNGGFAIKINARRGFNPPPEVPDFDGVPVVVEYFNEGPSLASLRE